MSFHWDSRKLLRRVASDQRGMALPLALVMLLVASLLVVSGLASASTGLKAESTIEKNVQALYAADAGVEKALWELKNNPPETFPATYQVTSINGMSVSATLELVESVYGIELSAPGVHSDHMSVDGSMVYSPSLGVYVYTLTVTNKDPSNIHLDKIVVMLPIGFLYVPGSSGGFTTSDPATRGTADTGQVLEWDFETPRPNIPAASHDIYGTGTETFYVTSAPGYTGDAGYLWVVAEREDVGLVGAPTYRITSRASQSSGAVLSTILAGALKDPGTGAVLVSSWEVNPVVISP